MDNRRIDIIESSLQKTNLWLKDVEKELHLKNRARAYSALRAVLHSLRECLPVGQAAKFAAQMPLIVSGIYYDGWKPRPKPRRISRAEFYDQVRHALGNQPDLDPALATQAVVRVIYRHLTPGEIRGVKGVLPKEIRLMWRDIERDILEAGVPEARPVSERAPVRTRGRAPAVLAG